MKHITSGILAAILCLISTNNSLAAISGCLQDTTLTTPITNGTKTSIRHAYVSPNCVANCLCAKEPTTYSCDCNTGYYANNQGTMLCDCLGKCPANSTCSSATSFSCNKGYYKNGSVCTRCPSSGGTYGTTASSGATSVTSCYLPSGTTGSDSSGSFTYTGNCYYSE